MTEEKNAELVTKEGELTAKGGKGIFLEGLKRNNREIREDRARSIAERAKVIYKRAVEDMELNLQELRQQQEAQLDQSPDNAMNLNPAKEFDPVKFCQDDIEFEIEIYNKEIILEYAKNRYEYLFGTD